MQFQQFPWLYIHNFMQGIQLSQREEKKQKKVKKKERTTEGKKDERKEKM